MATTTTTKKKKKKKKKATKKKTSAPRVTPDGRYFVVRGRLWRTSNPQLDDEVREALVKALMTARRAVGAAGRRGDVAAVAAARRDVDAAKHGLGERGPVWWTDGAPDFNRHLVKNTPYAPWFDDLVVGDGVNAS